MSNRLDDLLQQLSGIRFPLKLRNLIVQTFETLNSRQDLVFVKTTKLTINTPEYVKLTIKVSNKDTVDVALVSLLLILKLED